MIGVVVPVHNEEMRLERCLRSLIAAGRHPDLLNEEVIIVVVLDSCTDDSKAIAKGHGVVCLETVAKNVGTARALGANELLARGARWLAFTDADTMVCPAWIVTQIGLSAEAVCGTVAVCDWSYHSPGVRERYEAGYTDEDGHRHIHGANFGISAETYRRSGGFPPLASSEDVALVAELERIGARIAWSAAPRVTTSARVDSRVINGFGAFVSGLAAD